MPAVKLTFITVSAEITLEKTEKPYIILPTTKEPGKNLRFRLTVSVTNVPNAEGKKSKASSVLDLLPCNFAWIKKTYKVRHDCCIVINVSHLLVTRGDGLESFAVERKETLSGCPTLSSP